MSLVQQQLDHGKVSSMNLTHYYVGQSCRCTVIYLRDDVFSIKSDTKMIAPSDYNQYLNN